MFYIATKRLTKDSKRSKIDKKSKRFKNDTELRNGSENDNLGFVYLVLLKFKLDILARYLKITEKVSFNMASEASYVDILNGQKWI